MFNPTSISLQKKLVVLTTEWLPQLQSSCGYESFTLLLETNWIRQPEKQVPIMCISNHLTPPYTLKTLRTSVGESLQMHFKVAVRNFHVKFNASRWFPHANGSV